MSVEALALAAYRSGQAESVRENGYTTVVYGILTRTDTAVQYSTVYLR